MDTFGGLFAGGLIGSLFLGHGFNGFNFMDVVVVALVIYVLFKIFTRKRPTPPPSPYESDQKSSQQQRTHNNRANTNSPEYIDPEKQDEREQLETAYRAAESMWQRMETPQQGSSRQNQQPPVGFGNSNTNQTYDVNTAPSSVQATGVKGFDEEDFLRGAKLFYGKLQEAWDRRDLEEIRPYTTAEVFQELSRQAKQDPKPGQTDILLVKAKLADIQHNDGETLCAVQYDAMIRESRTQEDTTNVKEIWNFVRNETTPNALWLLAGIEQVQ